MATDWWKAISPKTVESEFWNHMWNFPPPKPQEIKNIAPKRDALTGERIK